MLPPHLLLVNPCLLSMDTDRRWIEGRRDFLCFFVSQVLLVFLEGMKDMFCFHRAFCIVPPNNLSWV